VKELNGFPPKNSNLHKATLDDMMEDHHVSNSTLRLTPSSSTQKLQCGKHFPAKKAFHPAAQTLLALATWRRAKPVI
jgi:hypothetical protein